MHSAALIYVRDLIRRNSQEGANASPPSGGRPPPCWLFASRFWPYSILAEHRRLHPRLSTLSTGIGTGTHDPELDASQRLRAHRFWPQSDCFLLLHVPVQCCLIICALPFRHA